ncbi:reverse transcriptase domain-containing protein [Tanacetum coccineum]
MSAMANATPIVTTVTKTANKEKATDAAPRVNIQNFCEEHYEDILPIIMEKARSDKRKEVQTRLNFGDNSKKNRRERENSNSWAESSPTRFRLEKSRARGRERGDVRNVFNRLSHRRKSVHERLSDTYSGPSRTDSRNPSHGRDRSLSREHPRTEDHRRDLEESYDDTYSQRTKYQNRSRDGDRFCNMKRWGKSETPSSRGSGSNTSNGGHWKSRTKRRKLVRLKTIWPFPGPVRMWIRSSPEFVLQRAARVWFYELPPESIDGYKGLKASFLAYFMQQKKYVKDPVEIHNIKQRDGETIEDFMECFKAETGCIKGAPECMRIFGFMHGVNNPELIKRLKTPKEILAAEAGKFKLPPPMVTPTEKRSSNKFVDFHNDKGHSTDECMQLNKQIEELVRAGKLSHLIKEIKQGRDQTKNGKKEAPTKEKSLAIYMIQPWQRTIRQKLTQSFARVNEITFPPLTSNDGTEGPLVIEAEIGGHMIHCMYIDGGSSMEILYEHCFNQLQPEIKNQMIPATTSSLSPYNGIIGRPGIREIQAVPSTAHGMLKFPADGGIVTIRSTILIPVECTTVAISPQEVPKEAEIRPKNFKIALHPNFLEQEVPSDMMGVPRSIAEHQLNLREGYSPVRQKKRGQAPERAKAIQAEVQKLVEAGIMREVYYHDWLSYPVMVKKHDGSWRMQLKQHLSELPLLVAPKPKEQLIVYLSASHGAISAVLMTERGAVQTPVYFVSRALQGPELNYTPMEKLVLSLVFAAKRLRRYFQAHLIVVITDQPIKQIISRPDVAGRLQKWSVMLGEHNITYRPRTSVKGQILADFLVEKPDENQLDTSVVEILSEPWTLFTDGSSCVDGSGAGLILTSPEGTEFTYALRFQFTVSNNEAEYEALIAGLRIAAQMDVRNVHVNVDSKLVANQVLGTYVAKEENMIKYLEKVKSLVSGFTNFSISQIPRGKNKIADALSKIASTSFAHLSKQVLVEVLKEKSIQEAKVTTVVEEDGPTWMTPIVEYLKDGTLPSNKKEASKLRIKARQYELLDGILYRRSFLKPWLRCVRPLQSNYVIREIHEGSCSMYTGPRSVVAKAMLLGYYWPTMHRDARDMIRAWEIVSDNGKQFSDDPFKDWANWSLGEGIKARLGEGNKNWVEELPHVLWAHRTMIKSSHDDTPFSLTYGTEAVIPAEIGMPTYRTTTVDAVHNNEELRINLDLLEERRERAAIREAKAKTKMTRYYNARVRDVAFRPGDFVYRNNDASHVVTSGKLGPKWEGPYEVTEALGDGAYKLRTMKGANLPRTWNIANMKKCYL